MEDDHVAVNLDDMLDTSTRYLYGLGDLPTLRPIRSFSPMRASVNGEELPRRQFHEVAVPAA